MDRAILFDMGGTLDGDGLHWLDRFAFLYASEGLTIPRDTLRMAFDEAERRSATDAAIASATLAQMLDQHLRWQFDVLASGRATLPLTEELRGRIGGRFCDIVLRAARTNAALLADLQARGFILGVVSNGCGNVDVLCRDLGYAPMLSLIVDSRRVGVFKPDPEIYRIAAARLALPPASIMMVGDSFERDVRPAKAIGMTTAWLRGPQQAPCPEPALADIVVRELADLPAALDARERMLA